MTGSDLFDPFAAFDPSWTGPQGAARLLSAAEHFPGGPVMLVLALFFAPVGPGIPAGVLLARHVPLPPLVTLALYAVSDLIGALVCHPLFTLLRRHGRRVPALRAVGRRFLALATWGVPWPAAAERGGGHAGALLRIATVGFGVDVYTAGLLATGLPVPRLPAWGAAIAGDLVWFALLLASSVAAAGVLDDDRFVGVVVIVAMIAIPRLARRFVPALRR